MPKTFSMFSLQDGTDYLPAATMQYKGKTIFCNENQHAKLPPKISLKAVFDYYYRYPKDSKPSGTIPFALSDFKAYQNTPNVAWLGHSSLFFTHKDMAILIDPLFSMHASPFSFINRAFPQTKCYKSDDFPNIFIVIITHAHFDHLDKRSILSLREQTQYFICPLRVGGYLRRWGIKQEKIIELDWWQGVRFFNLDSMEQDSVDFMKKSKDNLPFLQITATPSQHNSARMGGFNRTLWASFVLEFCPLETQCKKVFVSGDGGYYTHFKRIGDLFGGFDLACLESGQFNHAWRFSHSFPNEICKEALDLRSSAVLPIHWGRFLAGSHSWNHVVKYLCENLCNTEIACIVPKIGELYPIGTQYKNEVWWE